MLKEIAENDYNLNISRYVDTSEAEETVDINSISKKLKALNKEMETTDKTIAAFCKELKIETSF